MNKTLLIIQREYLSRVRKKSFLIMTFLVPVLLIGMYSLIYFLTVNGGDQPAKVEVIDESGIFDAQLKSSQTVVFLPSEKNLEQAKNEIKKSADEFILYIPEGITQKEHPQLISPKKPGLFVQNAIESQMNEILRSKMLTDAGIDPATLEKIKPSVNIISKQITSEGEKESSAGAAYGIGIAAAILIYMSLFIYGAQVMRGVIEEKTNRIIEVVISSVKPFQLMLGKIIGIGLVGLTQFILWITLSGTLLTLAGNMTGPADNFVVLKAIQTIPFGYIMAIFLVYYLGGYMLYSALFAAVGSAVDNETETQQFMFPMTLPLLFTYILSFSFIINNPDSTLSFWLSLVPFTSPIAMMVRLPFGVPGWQLAISITLLIAGFIFTTWVAARIYRVGILMYGKKASYKELIKWFKYKE